MAEEVRVVTFFLELPEPIAIAHDSTFTFASEDSIPGLEAPDEYWITEKVGPIPPPPEWTDKVFVSFRILQVDTAALTRVPPFEATTIALRGILPDNVVPPKTQQHDPPPQLSKYVTVVEAATLVRKDYVQDELSAAFDRCERYLAKLVDTYRIVAPRPIAPVAREVLPPLVPFITRDAYDPEAWDKSPSIFLLHANVPHSEQPLAEAEMEKFRILLSHTMVEHPFSAYSLRSREADAALRVRGDTGDVLVKSQIASEVLLDAVLTSMLWEENLTPEEAARDIFQEGLAKRVRTNYHERLGGTWQTTGRGAICHWHLDISSVRGRVVHGNYTPTRDEARAALEALGQLDAFIRRRLVANKNKYKRTTLMLLGRPGLERLSAWKGEIVKFVEERAAGEPDWRLSLKGWREQLNRAR